MINFTRGNWTACIDGTVDITDENGQLLSVYADILRDYEYEPELQGNARLIASAPEMYRLLKVWTQIQAQPMLMNERRKARELLARIDVEESVDD